MSETARGSGAGMGTAVIDPHSGEEAVHLGAAPGEADAAVVLVHGRGGSPEGMTDFARALVRPDAVWIAPRAAAGSWYPQSFLAPIEANQPWLDSALRTLDRTVDELRQEYRLPRERILLLGFSQGACLATEFVSRNPGRWGGLAALSGGLIGPPGTQWDGDSGLEGTPTFFGCGDPDPHIPRERVKESGRLFERRGAAVDVRIYPGLGHAVNADEVEAVQGLLDTL
ncbi:MAG: dienelactone hydrolase family protein [marine benthic group bacterium]|nr:dienelactone hydrolase family protein [Gemmatimonadota bacterium]